MVGPGGGGGCGFGLVLVGYKASIEVSKACLSLPYIIWHSLHWPNTEKRRPCPLRAYGGTLRVMSQALSFITLARPNVTSKLA